MSEFMLPAAEADALGGSTDPELDITYPAIGENPYYTTLYRLIHRLAAIVKTAGELRVYKDGELTFGVRAGRASRGASVLTFDGAEGQALSDDQTNYVYLTVSGTSLALNVGTAGFPDAATVPHVQLATIETGLESLAGVSGQYDHGDVADRRGASLLRVLGS